MLAASHDDIPAGLGRRQHAEQAFKGCRFLERIAERAHQVAHRGAIERERRTKGVGVLKRFDVTTCLAQRVRGEVQRAGRLLILALRTGAKEPGEPGRDQRQVARTLRRMLH